MVGKTTKVPMDVIRKNERIVTMRARKRVHRMFESHAEEARDVILEIMRDNTAEAGVRLKAANDILDRAYGKPAQEVRHQPVDGDGSLEVAKALENMDADELMAMQMMLRRLETARDSAVEDAEIVNTDVADAADAVDPDR